MIVKNPLASSERFNAAGFTVVELLVVVVVIGIIATVTVAQFRNIQDRSINAVRYQEVTEWKKVFGVYAAIKGHYPPSIPLAKYCLGTGFPMGTGNVARCHNYKDGDPVSMYYPPDAPNSNYDGINVLESYNADLINELQTIIPKLPQNSRKPIGNIVGPWIWYRGVGESPRIYTNFHKSVMSTCPGEMELSYDGTSGIVCYLILPEV